MPSERVKEFYEYQSFAIIGMSQKKKNFGWMIYEQLAAKGKRVYAIHPSAGRRSTMQFYASIKELPEVPEGIIVAVDLRKARGLLEELSNSGAKAIWFQQGCFDNSVIAQANQLGLDPIKGCAFMYMPGTQAFHRIHRVLNDLIGKGYK